MGQKKCCSVFCYIFVSICDFVVFVHALYGKLSLQILAMVGPRAAEEDTITASSSSRVNVLTSTFWLNVP